MNEPKQDETTVAPARAGRRPYEPPAVVAEEGFETLAGNCGFFPGDCDVELNS